MRCQEAFQRLAEGGLERGSWLQRTTLRAHLVVCADCRRALRQLRLLGRAARAAAAGLLDASRRAALEARLLARLTK